jgi:hypothetical protein
MKSIIFTVGIVTGLVFFHLVPSFAMDELYLCGTVTNMDTQKNLVTVDVKSESCHGVHEFGLSAELGKNSVAVGEMKCFYIDSSRCQKDMTPQITKLINRGDKTGMPAEPVGSMNTRNKSR